jgi:transportin-3
MPESPREAVLEGVGWVVLNSPDALLRTNLEKLCAPFASRLSQIAQELGPSSELVSATQPGIVSEVQGILSIVGTLFKSSITTPASPAELYHIFSQLWQFACYFARVFDSSEELIERVMRIVKYSMRKCREQFTAHLADLATLISQGFNRHPFSAYLYTAENLVRVYGEEVSCFELLSQLFLTLTETAVRLLDSPQAVKDKPDITEDFFGMVVRYFNYCSPAVLQGNALSKILHCAKLGIGIEQPDAANCLYGFFLKLMSFADENSRSYNPRISGELKQQFAEIVVLIFQALVSAMPRIIVDNIVDLLVSCQRIFPNEGWLAKAVLQEVPYDCMTELEKKKMIEDAANPERLQMWLYNLNRRAHVRAKRSKK